MIGVCECTLQHALMRAFLFARFIYSLRRKQFVHVTVYMCTQSRVQTYGERLSGDGRCLGGILSGWRSRLISVAFCLRFLTLNMASIFICFCL